MKRILAILAGVAMVCVVAYLSWLNPTAVDFRYTPTRTVHGAPLAALLVLAFVAGVLLVLAAVLVQAGRRAIVGWRLARQQRHSERTDRLHERGEELVWQGDAQHGRGLLQKAWRRRPSDVFAVLALATSYQDTGEVERARQLLVEASSHHHINPDVLLALADAHRLAGDRVAALAVLERLRALHPRAPRALRALRDAYVAARRWHDAAMVQEALVNEVREPTQAARERDFLTTLRYQASLHVDDPRPRAHALEALADSRMDAVPILVSLGDALLSDGRADEASVLWERALRNVPRTVFVERLANIATEPRHRDRLCGILRKLHPDHVRADNVHLQAARLYLVDGNVSEATRELEAVQQQSGNATPAAHRLWAELHRRGGHLEQAVSAYAQAECPAELYHCRRCERATREWVGYCPHCGEWDSYRATTEIGI